MNRTVVILLGLFSILSLYSAEGYIVDGDNGNDNNNGETINDPFKTITRCVESLVNPGDECLIRAGNYHEVVSLSGLQGKTIVRQEANKNILFGICLPIYFKAHQINHSGFLISFMNNGNK